MGWFRRTGFWKKFRSFLVSSPELPATNPILYYNAVIFVIARRCLGRRRGFVIASDFWSVDSRCHAKKTLPQLGISSLPTTLLYKFSWFLWPSFGRRHPCSFLGGISGQQAHLRRIQLLGAFLNLPCETRYGGWPVNYPLGFSKCLLSP